MAVDSAALGGAVAAEEAEMARQLIALASISASLLREVK